MLFNVLLKTAAADHKDDETTMRRIANIRAVGKSPADAKQIARNDTEYRKWIVKGDDALFGAAVGVYNAQAAITPAK